MSIPSDEMGNRRSACDRCRSHKLRCERGPDSLQCRRCVKANAKCITGATLKSGRPLQLHGMRMEQPHLDQEVHQEGHTHLNHHLGLLDFPTPPPTTFDTHFETIPPHSDGDLDMQLQVPTITNFNAFDEIWTDSFGQETTSADLAHSAPRNNANQNEDEIPLTTPPPSNIRSGCMKKLGDLQTKVLADLEISKACKTADKCSQEKTNSDSGKSNFLVGRMLDHSTELLEILDCFESVPTDLATVSSEVGHRAVNTSPSGLRCDSPTMLSLFSCYVCLTRIYRTIFSSIHDSMSFLLRSNQPVPQLFPGMDLGGFKLEARLDLQVQILIQVSEDLLTKIETKFGIADNNNAAGKGSIFEHKNNATEILRVMLEEEAREQPQLDEKRGHCGSLRDILASLKRLVQPEGISDKS